MELRWSRFKEQSKVFGNQHHREPFMNITHLHPGQESSERKYWNLRRKNYCAKFLVTFKEEQTDVLCAQPRTGRLCSRCLKPPRTSLVPIYWESVIWGEVKCLCRAHAGKRYRSNHCRTTRLQNCFLNSSSTLHHKRLFEFNDLLLNCSFIWFLFCK